MNFEPTTCPDCNYPPNFITLQLPSKNGCVYFSVKCRDCGDIWDEPAEFFSDTTDVDQESQEDES